MSRLRATENSLINMIHSGGMSSAKLRNPARLRQSHFAKPLFLAFFIKIRFESEFNQPIKKAPRRSRIRTNRNCEQKSFHRLNILTISVFPPSLTGRTDCPSYPCCISNCFFPFQNFRKLNSF